MVHHGARSVHALLATAAPIAKRAMVAWTVVALSGCAVLGPCQPIRAAWYLDDDGFAAAASPQPRATAPTIYLALLNEGMQASNLQRIVVNPSGPARVGTQIDTRTPLEPGELRLFRVDGPLGTCRLPVKVQVACGDGRTQTLSVSGALPNYLHSSWVEDCR